MEKELVLVDNTVLSNFALIERDDILNSLFRDLLYTTNEVLQELKLTTSQKVQFVPYLSFLRKQESSDFNLLWTPVFTGVTGFLTFCEIIKTG